MEPAGARAIVEQGRSSVQRHTSTTSANGCDMPPEQSLPRSLTSRSLTKTLLLVLACGSAGVNAAASRAAERPTFNHTNDPRPDILPHPFYYAHTEYRRAYNRPRYVTGWIADKISVTSQEAMVWQENVAEGRYAGKHCPPVYKTYYYRKPWEALQTGPRPDFPKPAMPAPLAPAPAPNAIPAPAPVPDPF